MNSMALMQPDLQRSLDAVNKRLSQLDSIVNRLNALEARTSGSPLTYETAVQLLQQVINVTVSQVQGAITAAEERDRDIIELLHKDIASRPVARVVTEFPVATQSDDHKFPHGTMTDNTRHPRFVHVCESIFPGRTLSHLDLGCAGGALVWDFLRRGHFSIGIEGSDYCLRTQRAEWRIIPNNLFLADITKPFGIVSADSGEPLAFDLVTAWEVLEHIPEQDLAELFANIRRFMKPDGLFASSVATFEDGDPVTGAVWHVTVKPQEWWLARIAEAGFEPVQGLFETADFPRIPLAPERGFHLVMRVKR
jgi:2-polyprenyl-3-methyl-5-hydroxy-6-metoxy-1,4-benzoquinol methylase